MAENHLREIAAQGQSIWLDNISRQLLDSGTLERMIKEDAVTGVTSNPTIFEKAIGKSDLYDDGLQEAVSKGLGPRDIFFQLAFRDIRDGADLLRGVWEQTEGLDGYISFELPPELADDAEGSIEAAKHFRQEIDRPNVLIKVPGTAAGVKAFEELTAAGVSVNVTLLFAVGRYEEIAEAYVRGLERRADAGEPIDRIASVASFFVSRVDSKVDAALEKAGRTDLAGKAAVANARIAYESFQRIFSGERWEKLKAKGANVQRPLWASTSTKNPSYPDTLYVDELIGPDTVNTMPDATVEAARDHATVSRTVDKDYAAAHKVIDDVKAAGVDFDDIVDRQLVEEGVASFAKSFDSLIETIAAKAAKLRNGELSAAGQDARREGLLALRQKDAVRKLFAKDASLWPGGKGADWLGWIDTVGEQRAAAESLLKWARETMQSHQHAVLCGMGGSSLAPLVFATSFGLDRLLVLDSTDPDAVRAMPRQNALYVISSKSGSTIEPNCFADYFWHESDGDGSRFVAITDPGSSLHKRADNDGWHTIFRGRPDVGGRYSALSPFGIVPAALGGAPVVAILDDALAMLQACGPDGELDENPGAQLGALIGQSAKSGRDKLTIVASPGYESFGLWLEQLVAESTGKRGVGIVPVAGEPVGPPEVYGDDRVFVHVRADGTHDEAMARLAERHPVLTLPLDAPEHLGGEMVRWEVAVALAGAILEIDPFDQPNVQEAKDATVALLDEYTQTHELPAEEPGSLEDVLAAAKRGRSYVTLQVYTAPTDEAQRRLEKLQGRIRDATGCATAAGFGPRYLHSTGQLHKGGPPEGVFVQLLHDVEHDLHIPGRPYGFLTLRDAQALGDTAALRSRNLPVARRGFADLDEVEAAIERALSLDTERV
jgi:transaldolase / glucose-6-phosphate isomerase